MHFVGDSFLFLLTMLKRALMKDTQRECADLRTLCGSPSLWGMLANKHLEIPQHIRKWAPHASEHEHTEPMGLNQKIQNRARAHKHVITKKQKLARSSPKLNQPLPFSN